MIRTCGRRSSPRRRPPAWCRATSVYSGQVQGAARLRREGGSSSESGEREGTDGRPTHIAPTAEAALVRRSVLWVEDLVLPQEILVVVHQGVADAGLLVPGAPV